jgi:acetyl-CoA synthetase/medium-chain acyl-CoA synthetase
VKKLRIGRRRVQRGAVPTSPLELALYPALEEGRWEVPDRFNFMRDIVEVLALDPKRQAVMALGKDGVIEPRTFLQLAEKSARWAWLLRERGVGPGDRVLVLMGMTVEWLEVALACLKVGAVLVPGPVTMSTETLEDRTTTLGARLVVAARAVEAAIVQMIERPQVLYVDEARELLPAAPEQAATHESSSHDLAFVLTSAGASEGPRLIGHSNDAVFAARVAAEYWLDAGRGDAVWCTAAAGSANTVLHTLLGPWSRGAKTLVHEDDFEPLERLDLIHRLGVTILCQTPAEYAELAARPELARFRSPQLRRLVSTGDYLDPDVSKVFEETWGLVIHDGYGQAETNIIVAHGADAEFKPGSLGFALPGHHVAVVDEGGNQLPPGVDGELAVRGRPPTLFAGYWESPVETRSAQRGDWYVTGDIATMDADGFFWFEGRAADMLTSRGERFGPYPIERALRLHDAVAASAVVGVRDLQRGGQFLRAFVVLAPGVEGSEGLEAELRQDATQSLPEHEVPREIEFVDELPTTQGGKVRRLELRERLVVGRPLWEIPATTGLEPELLEPLQSQPAWDDAVGGWTVPGAAAAASQARQEGLPDYIVVPEPEPLPEPELERAPLEVEAAAVPVQEPVQEPAPEPEPTPQAVVVPDPEPQFEPAPIAEAVPVQEPAFEPEPELSPEPEWEPVLEAAPALELVEEPAPAPAPAPGPEREPELDVESQPVAEAAPELVPVLEPPPEPEPEPVVAFEPKHVPEFSAGVEEALAPGVVSEPEPLPEYIVDPTTTPEPAALTPEPVSALEPEPDPGPLPDYIVDPTKPRPPVLKTPKPEPPPTLPPEPEVIVDPAPPPDEPSLAGLGLPPLTDFPSLQREPATESGAATQEPVPAPREKRPPQAPVSSRRGRRDQSAQDPGDEAEAVDWMDGLSSRLSAYSLADDSSAPKGSTQGDGKVDENDSDTNA